MKMNKLKLKPKLIKLNSGFDPNDLNSPDMKEYFSKFKVGGLGVPIMKKFMNKIEYVHKNSDYNSLTLIKVL